MIIGEECSIDVDGNIIQAQLVGYHGCFSEVGVFETEDGNTVNEEFELVISSKNKD
jgi:hypothetical protein